VEERRIVVYAALAANAGIAIAKYVVAAISGSSALLAEAIHSSADTGNEILLLIGQHRARKPPDAHHPFGHGKEVYFWSLMVAVMLFAFGGGMSIFEGIHHLETARELGDPLYSYVVLAVAFVFEGSSLVVGVRPLWRNRRGRSLFRTWSASKDPSVLTVVAEDSAALVGLLIAFAGVFLSHVLEAPILDAVASLGVGALLVGVASLLAWENRGLIIGEAAHTPLVEDVRAIIERDGAVCRTGELLTMQLGPSDVLLDANVEFASDLSGDELRDAIVRVEEAIKAAHPEVSRIFLEARSIGERDTPRRDRGSGRRAPA
jgi:cation diffusion facilitator family transporter